MENPKSRTVIKLHHNRMALNVTLSLMTVIKKRPGRCDSRFAEALVARGMSPIKQQLEKRHQYDLRATRAWCEEVEQAGEISPVSRGKRAVM